MAVNAVQAYAKIATKFTRKIAKKELNAKI